MPIQLFNTLAGEKQPLALHNPPKVGIYVCGVTVYDLCHIGHARVMVAFDVIVRYLRSQGYDVTYVRNITDIDDKIFGRAQERGVSFKVLTDEMVEAMHQDFGRLSVLPPDHEPRASEYLDEMLTLIQTLEKKGAAYQGANGDVYFRVAAYPDYGKLNNRKLEDMLAGARVDVAEDKESSADFVLWKMAKPGEASWPSPWGEGRPGWHIECSAMSMALLGESFDLHGGGPDLKFPHHENEIAQSEAATCKPYATQWLHAGAVRVGDEKMSKSLGNFFTIREVLEHYNAEVVRFFLLQSQYRGHISYTEAALVQAAESLERIYRSLRIETTQAEPCVELMARFESAMNDDFNTPGALSLVFEAVKRINTAQQAAEARAFIVRAGEILGLFDQAPEDFRARPVAEGGLSEAEILALIDARTQAKQSKDFARADAIRAELLDQGIEIKDSREGVQWSRV